MEKGSMIKGTTGMSNDGMSKEGMSKDGMKKDSMQKDGMKKDGDVQVRGPGEEVQVEEVQGSQTPHGLQLNRAALPGQRRFRLAGATSRP